MEKVMINEHKKTFKKSKKTAEQGNVEFQYGFGAICDEEDGTEEDYDEEINFFKKPAEQGFAYGQCNLGLMYLKGLGVE